MDKKVYYAIKKFYHDMAVTDLRLMNRGSFREGITYNSLLYLDLIYTHQGEYTASAIAELLHVSKPAVITKVNELMKQNLIYKKQSQTDKRVYFLFVNEEIITEYSNYKRKGIFLLEQMKKEFKEEEINSFCNMLEFVGKFYMEDTK